MPDGLDAVVAEVQRASDEWFASRADPWSAYTTLSIPIEALPALKRIWSEAR